MASAGTDRNCRQRGAALVEMLLSAPIVLVVVLLMLDFARGFKAQHRTERAARQQAWSRARLDEWKQTGADALSAERLLHVHYDDVGERPATQVSDEDDSEAKGRPLLLETSYRTARPVNFGLVRMYIGVLGYGRWFESEAWDHASGKITRHEAFVRQAQRRPMLRLLSEGELASRHQVSIWAHIDWSPDDPEGWWRNPSEVVAKSLLR